MNALTELGHGVGFPPHLIQTFSPLADLIHLQDVWEKPLPVLDHKSVIQLPWPQEVIPQHPQGTQVGLLWGQNLKHALARKSKAKKKNQYLCFVLPRHPLKLAVTTSHRWTVSLIPLYTSVMVYPVEFKSIKRSAVTNVMGYLIQLETHRET